MNLLADPVIGTTAVLLLTAIMGGAAFHKLADRVRFVETVRDYRVLPTGLAGLAAGVVVVVEGIACLLLVVPPTRTLGAVAIGSLLVVYAAMIGLNLARGRTDIDCGCSWAGGGQPISAWLIARNLTLLPIAALAGGVWSERALVLGDGFTVVAATLTLLFFYHAADRLIANWAGLATLRAS